MYLNKNRFIICKDIKIIINFLNKIYNDSLSSFEVKYRLQHFILEKPKCKNCGKPLVFHNHIKNPNKTGYYNYCDTKCQQQYYEKLEFSDEIVKNSSINKIKAYVNKSEKFKNQYFNRFQDTKNFSEIFYRIKNSLESAPLCPVCNNPIKFYRGMYRHYCSYKCCNTSKDAIKLRLETYKKSKNSVIYSDEFQDLNDEKILNILYKNKKYRPKVLYFISKRPQLSEYLKNRFSDIDDIEESLYRIANNINIENLPKCKNCGNITHFNGLRGGYFKYCSVKCTLNYPKNRESNFKSTNKVSKLEKSIINKIIEIVNPEIFYTQFKTELYPYHCDLMFKKNNNNFYVEIQGNWTHGPHPFDFSNNEDIRLLNSYKELAKEHPYYQNTINVWSKTDIEKRNLAIKNNLNFIEIFPKHMKYDHVIFTEEFEVFLKNLKVGTYVFKI